MNERLAMETWDVRKPTAYSEHGVVATQHYMATQVGIDILRRGGNAVDAAVAAGLAIGTVEPESSGIGGGGYMNVFLAETQTTHIVEFGMRAAFESTPKDYPLAEGNRLTGAGTFNWPAVEGNTNVTGPLSIAVPGYIRGVSLALESFGTQSWEEVIDPACQLAEAGLPVDWYTTLIISGQVRNLMRDETSSSTYLRDGLPPLSMGEGALGHIPLGELAKTYRTLQREGPESYYTGTLAQLIAADLQAKGSRISLDDLQAYEAKIADPIPINYRNAQISGATDLTAGPSLKRALANLESQRISELTPGNTEVIAYVQALRDTYDFRLAKLGEGAPTGRDSSTSHLAVADEHGNLVSLTQTIMSQFGSHVMLPQTGLLMNNGMMWFDPRAGKPNSLVGGRRPLCNMCPTLIHHADGSKTALGACGGRKILASVFQLASFLVDFNMNVDQAVHAPRVDVSGNENIWVMDHFDESIIAALVDRFGAQDVKVRKNGMGSNQFAVPQIVNRDSQGTYSGNAYVPSPHSLALGV